MKEATDKAAAFDNKFKKLGTDITAWTNTLKTTKNARVKKDLQAKLATAKKAMGQFDEMQQEAKTKLAGLQKGAAAALATKEGELDVERKKFEGEFATVETAWKTNNEAFNEAEAQLLDNKDAKLKAGLEKARDAAKKVMEAKKIEFDAAEKKLAPLRDEFTRRTARADDAKAAATKKSGAE